MLIEEVSDPYIRLMVIGETLEKEKKEQLVGQAFLYIISTRNAFKFKKLEMLTRILTFSPSVIDEISDEVIINHFEELRDIMVYRHEMLSTAELEWITKYVRSPESRLQAEKIIYSVMLLGSDYWDKIRHEFTWSISKSDRKNLIKKTLKEERLGDKRKMELAKEIDEPAEKYTRSYFRKLLWDRHYDLAEELGVRFEEDIIKTVINNLDAGYFDDALKIVQRFLPERQDLADEIKSIQSAFKNT